MHEYIHSFKGTEYRLCLTARALFAIYDRYGYTTTIVEDLHLDDETLEGFGNLCWLYALLAQQGELRARYLGEVPQKLLKPGDLETMADPADVPELKCAVLEALRRGFSRSVTEDDGPRDLVLEEIETAEKKKKALARIMRVISLSALSSCR